MHDVELGHAMGNCRESSKTLHIAPMLHVSNREFRHLFRIMSKKCVLWTEMVVDETVVYSQEVEDHLGYDPETSPIICQIGGNSPDYAGKAVQIIEKYGYDEINLNVDCPSDRVSGKREFGAVLMKKGAAACMMVRAMKENCTIPISVKCRIGIDEHDSMEFVVDFISSLKPHCKKFVIHARTCTLGGLTPAQNRIVPPLNYPRVYALCDAFPDCEFWINGGISGLRAAKRICHGSGEAVGSHKVPCSLCNASNGSCVAPPQRAPPNLKGCMLGRAAMDNPALFWDVDRYFYGLRTNPCQNRRQVLKQYCLYLEKTYPRRCCDDDERMMTKIPAPQVVQCREYCSVCQDMYIRDKEEKKECNATALKSRVKFSKIKISSRVIDRSLKPVLGMFFGLPKSKTFRRVCDELSRDMTVRNCGPGFILRKAMCGMPSKILDQDFCRTENLSDAGVVMHIAPRHDNSC
jgi:tRNA-dihydrouridine synthase A